MGKIVNPKMGNTSRRVLGQIFYVANRLKELRDEKGWTHKQAADAMAVSRGQFIKLERGERRLTTDYLERAARAFGVSPAAIINTSAVPLVGYVGAGTGQAHFYAGGQVRDEVEAPEGATPETVAVEVRGDSLGSFFEQWLIFFDDVRSPVTSDLIGRVCVVGLPDDRILVKKIRPGSRPGLFHLFGQYGDPVMDTPIDWAARVKTMVPR